MRKIQIIMITLLSLFISGSDVFAIHEIIPSETNVAMPGPDAEKIIEYISRFEPYRSWRIWPGMNKLTPGKPPHGDLTTVFVNDFAYLSIKKHKVMADGSLIVMENYTKEKKFLGLSVMYKISKYNPEAGDWFWAEYRPEGSVAGSGKADTCLACHGEAKANDFIKSRRIIR